MGVKDHPVAIQCKAPLSYKHILGSAPGLVQLVDRGDNKRRLTRRVVIALTHQSNRLLTLPVIPFVKGIKYHVFALEESLAVHGNPVAAFGAEYAVAFTLHRHESAALRTLIEHSLGSVEQIMPLERYMFLALILHLVEVKRLAYGAVDFVHRHSGKLLRLYHTHQLARGPSLAP